MRVTVCVNSYLSVFQPWCSFQCNSNREPQASFILGAPCRWHSPKRPRSLCATFSGSDRAYFFQGLSWLLLLKDNEIFQFVSFLAFQISLKPCWVKSRHSLWEWNHLLFCLWALCLSFHCCLCMVNMKINYVLRKQWSRLRREQWSKPKEFKRICYWKMCYSIFYYIWFWMVNSTWSYSELLFTFFCLICITLAFGHCQQCRAITFERINGSQCSWLSRWIMQHYEKWCN